MDNKISAGKYNITLEQLIVIYLKQVAIVTIPLLLASLGLFLAIINLNNVWYEIAASFVVIVLFVIAKLYIDEKVAQELRKFIIENKIEPNTVGDIHGK
jgi:hypothetical protein